MTDYTLGYANIYVSNFARAVTFYTEKLGLETAMQDDEFGYCSFLTGPARMAIALAEGDHAHLVGRHTGVGLMVDDLDAAHAELEAKGVKFTMKPEKQPWGGYMGLFEDSEGNILYLDQKMAHHG